MLNIANLECVRGDRQLFSDLSFAMDGGSLLHVHGANGSGKTTLLRAIAGLVLPEAGAIQWNGVSTRKLGEDFNRELLYLGHHDGLKFELTGYENLNIFARLSGFNISARQVEVALKRMGLARCVELPVKVLSQGQKKRVALARLLLQPARLWILDEPFVALDVAAVSLLLELIQQHVADGGMVILTTHQAVDVDVGQLQHLHLGEH
ncbi:heme ABC transporter ATP-binding protein [Candidatus Tenderia electrophaga]|jgi:heme exporter protein A|uniref:Heme ABC transporter ATP-binding protein n=1 Tax=Candidatus Tenderia electrophaga TaxID=1748243 RepID=A0A0S2THL2_9GAMM|nr:heme ABC transporter ATP-binding protein [Candidatus Tenderia electrophaga]